MAAPNARNNMPTDIMSMSASSSLIEDQYDMIDDLSEISNDDHETASLASESSSRAVQEIGDSVADLDDDLDGQSEYGRLSEHPLPNRSDHYPLADSPAWSSGSPADRDLAANKLLESFTSEDLDTPTQSMVPPLFASTIATATATTATDADTPSTDDAAAAATATAAEPKTLTPMPVEPIPNSNTNTILFVSDKLVNNADMNKVLNRIAYSLDSLDQSLALRSVVHPVYSVVGTTFNSIVHPTPTKTVMRAGNSVSAVVYHCIDGQSRVDGSLYLRVLGSGFTGSTIYNVGMDNETDLPKPTIAVFYISKTKQDLSWMETVYDVVEMLRVPVLVVDALDGARMSQRLSHSNLINAAPMNKLSLDLEELENMDMRDLRASLRQIRDWPESSTSKVKKSLSSFGTFGKLRLFVALLMFVGIYVLPTLMQTPQDSSAWLQVRREMLQKRVQQSTDYKVTLKDRSINHLLPTSMTECFSSNFFGIQHMNASANTDTFNCATHTPYDVISPQHFIVSLPGLSSFPKVTSVRISKANGFEPFFKLNELIPGVYDIRIDPEDSHGFIHVNMITTNPSINITFVTFNWDSVLTLPGKKTYEKMTADVSKAVGHDLSVMRHAAQDLTNMVSGEFAAGTEATKNVARDLSQAVAREVQVIGNTALAVFEKALHAATVASGNRTVTDFVLIPRDLVKFSKDLSTRVQDSVAVFKTHTKAVLREPLEKSRDRLHEIQQRWRDRRAAKHEKKKVKKAVKQLAKKMKEEKCGHRGGVCRKVKATRPLAPRVAEGDESTN